LWPEAHMPNREQTHNLLKTNAWFSRVILLLVGNIPQNSFFGIVAAALLKNKWDLPSTAIPQRFVLDRILVRLVVRVSGFMVI